MSVSPDEFIEEFEERRKRAGLSDQNGVTAVLTTSGRSNVSFDQIEVAPWLQGTGLAHRTLALLVRLSDETGIGLELIPRKLPGRVGMCDEQLAAWYRRNGFVDSPTPETPRRMARTPREQNVS